MKGKSLPSIFTFNKDLVRKWLADARRECCSDYCKNEEIIYGGPPFSGDIFFCTLKSKKKNYDNIK